MTKPLPVVLSAAAAAAVACWTATPTRADPPAEPTAAADPALGSVIFVHPDGASSATYAAARALLHGPDGELHWDRLPHIAVYTGHMADSLTSTSHGGATTHAHGVKVPADSYGMAGSGGSAEALVDANGRSLSVAQQAIRVGLPVGLVQSGTSTEPGTGCFLASVPQRKMHNEIAEQLVNSGAAVLLGGGERYFIPKGTEGVHGPSARDDDKDLIALAEQKGYTVVRTRAELLALPGDTTKVLGLFAHYHTFNDKPEEVLEATGKTAYDPDAPTLAEMTQAALDVLGRHDKRFLLVVEEEGTDNFGNNNNASGTLEAARRADAAFGVCRQYLQAHPQTLLITAADSDGGGLRMVGIPSGSPGDVPDRLPAWDRNGAPIDGVRGTGSAPFLAAPDRAGRQLPFYIVWSAQDDVSGGILVRAEGLHADLVQGTVDNTDIAKIIRTVLFGTQAPE